MTSSQGSLGVAARIDRFFRRLYHLPRELRIVDSKVTRIEADLAAHIREVRLLLSSLVTPEREIWHDALLPNGEGPGSGVFPTGALCREEDFSQAYFSYWSTRLAEPLRYHRKLWEFVFICQALWERGAVVSGHRGLGFGVGVEPLAAFFASQDCRILATDLAATAAIDLGWTETNQHAAGKVALRKPWVCPDDLFDRNVEFHECDMNHIPADYVDFDFCWSACALEHLGSIEYGLAFIERSIDCLKPGGWAAHTTEFNVSSDDITVDHQPTVLFRRRDIEGLLQRLRAKGHNAVAVNYDAGVGVLDQFIDVPPYREQPHLKMALSGFATTSIGILVQRGG